MQTLSTTIQPVFNVDFRSEAVGHLLDKYSKYRADIPTEARMRILRLIENMTEGSNAKYEVDADTHVRE